MSSEIKDKQSFDVAVFFNTYRKTIRAVLGLGACGTAIWLIINSFTILLQALFTVVGIIGCLWLARWLWIKNKEDRDGVDQETHKHTN